MNLMTFPVSIERDGWRVNIDASGERGDLSFVLSHEDPWGDELERLEVLDLDGATSLAWVLLRGLSALPMRVKVPAEPRRAPSPREPAVASREHLMPTLAALDATPGSRGQGVRWSEWWETARAAGIARATFSRHKKRLVDAGDVVARGGLFLIARPD